MKPRLVADSTFNLSALEFTYTSQLQWRGADLEHTWSERSFEMEAISTSIGRLILIIAAGFLHRIAKVRLSSLINFYRMRRWRKFQKL